MNCSLKVAFFVLVVFLMMKTSFPLIASFRLPFLGELINSSFSGSNFNSNLLASSCF